MNEIGVVWRIVLNAVVMERVIRYCPRQISAGFVDEPVEGNDPESEWRRKNCWNFPAW
jgi:hypothetical protein